MSLLGRHEKVLTLDGDWLRMIPTDAKTLIEIPKTSSFPVSSIVVCKQNRKQPNQFKIIRLKGNGERRRYDIEAVNENEASEIVRRIKALIKVSTERK